jgi:acyl-coenzyme A thioesterase PaaI-like protein
MSELRTDANTCFVCGPGNPDGLQLVFRLEDDLCLSEVTPGKNHCGYDGVTHGGLIFSALDDVMANWIFLKGIRAYTAKCEIRYKAPLPTGTAVILIGECLRQKARLVQMKGTMVRADDSTTVAETEASFMIDR